MDEGFLGYSRSNGMVGIRNKIAVISSVVCANTVARRVAEKVDNGVAITHPHGCGQFGTNFSNTFNILAGLGSNPNVYGVLVIGLGCENLFSNDLAEKIRESKKPVESFDIQDVRGGTIGAIEKGIAICKEFGKEAKKLRREFFEFSHLTLGLECGGSDATSGLTANPALGIVSDKLVNLGGTSILPEFLEWGGAVHLLSKRAINEEVAKQIEKPFKRFSGENRSPGNIAGGLSTPEEKSLGNIAKAGKSPIQGVIKYTEKPGEKSGLWLMIEPGLDVVSVTALAAAGANVIVFTTGRGTPFGNPVAPVIKICGNPKTCEYMGNNFDIDASKIITDNKTIEEISELLWKKLKEVCNGEKTISESLGFEEDIGFWGA
ncbi:MAG: UxaA family hydrolase [Promethearchaeota archaeon]|jgi:altronate dehydratase large subunit